jgi:rubrerythrin
MDDPEAPLKPIRELLETIRERVDYAISRLKSFEEVRSLAWRCETCGHVKKFTRKVPGETAQPCPKCEGVCFHPV